MVKDLERQVASAQERIASQERLRVELEGSLAQAQAKRHELLADGRIPESDSALASLPSDIEHIKGQIRQKRDELESLARQSGSAAERLSAIRRELNRIKFHGERDGLYAEMTAIIERWNECAAQLEKLKKEAGDTTSTSVDGEFATLPPDLVRFAGNGRAALKAAGLRADVPLFMDGARGGMFL
jgi:chromosome segregation ATPase